MTLRTVNHQSVGSLEVYMRISEMCPFLQASLCSFLKGHSHRRHLCLSTHEYPPSPGRCCLVPVMPLWVWYMPGAQETEGHEAGGCLWGGHTLAILQLGQEKFRLGQPDMWPGKLWEGGRSWTHLSRKSSSSSLPTLCRGQWWPGDLGRIWCFLGSKAAEEGMGKLCFKSGSSHLAWKRRTLGQTEEFLRLFPITRVFLRMVAYENS